MFVLDERGLCEGGKLRSSALDERGVSEGGKSRMPGVYQRAREIENVCYGCGRDV